MRLDLVFYEGEDVFIRAGQQDILFSLGQNETTSFEVRYGDGWWQTLYQGGGTNEVLWTTPPTEPGLYTVWVDYEGSDWDPSYSFDLFVVPAAQRAFTSDESNTYDPRTGTTGTLHHTMLLWSGTDGGDGLDKPLLVVEGIDASNKNSPAAYYALGADPEALLFPRGQAEGADIVVLDLGDGGRSLQANAAVVRQAITFLRSYKTDPSRGLDVVGISMGGVVARYALAQMEQERSTHGVASFVSIDGPHQGAVVDLDLQRDIKENSDPDEWPVGLARPAGRQLLQQNAFDPSSPTEHQRFYAELRALNGGRGYPRLTDNTGVSFGTPDPNPNPGQRWARLDFDPAGGWNYDVAGPTAQAGSYLPLDVTQVMGFTWTSFPGLPPNNANFIPVWYEIERYDPVHPTFMPYTSALDLTNGASAFDHTIAVPAGQTPSFHNVVPPLIVDRLLHRLGYALPPPLSASISGPSSLATGQTGYWRAATPDPEAGYQYNWEYRTYVPSCGGGPGAASAPGPELRPPTGRPGGPTTNALPCGEWHAGFGSGAVFPYQSQSSLRLELRVRATGGGGSVTSPIKRVCVGDCYGGGLGALTAYSPQESSVGEAPTSNLGGGTPALSLSPVAPNPFGFGDGSRATVRYTVPEAGPVRLRVFDAVGREVARLRDGTVGAGAHEATFEAGGLPPGVYVVRLEAGGSMLTQLVTYAR